MNRRALLVAMLLLLPLAAAADDVTEVIATRRPAEELLPVLHPLASSEVSVQAYRGQLILQGPASRVQDLLDVVQKLDRPLRNLRISVRRATTAEDARRDVVAQGSKNGAAVMLHHSERRSDDLDAQSLTMLEGQAAWLSVDTEIPVLGFAASGTPYAYYEPLGNGLSLAPSLAGDRVRLAISQRVAQLAGSNGYSQAVQATTVQSVLLLTPGEWTPLGDLAPGDGGSTATSFTLDGKRVTADQRQRSGRQPAMHWEVKVEVLEE